MLNFLYTLFIAPLEFWMDKVLVWGYSLVGNWGWAIIVMSLVVNFVILPIYIKAESWQEAEQRTRMGFARKEAMIKRAFSGQERFAMLSTMRRQAGYTAFLSMRSSVGFFLQIPFFFAAYHYLSTFEPLAGVSFMGLSDLAKPDEAFFIGPFPVNVMPILMTVINIGSALIYTKNLARRDKIQLYSVAALFLVLLYDAASGLVLYWTMNNLFSFAKNVVYDVLRRSKALIAKIPSRLNLPAVPASPANLLSLLPFVFWCGGFVFGCLASGQALFFSDSLRDVLGRTANILYLASVLAVFYEIVRLKLYRYRKALTVFLLILALGFLYFWVKLTFFRLHRFAFTLALAAWSFIPVMVVTSFPASFKTIFYPKDDLKGLWTASTYWLIFLLFNYLPVQAYCTAPEMFSEPQAVLARLLIVSAAFGALLWCLMKLWEFLGVLKSASVFLAFIAVLCTVYAFLFPMGTGTIDAFQLEKPRALFAGKNLALDAVVLVTVASLFVFMLRKGASAVLVKGFGILIVFSLAAGVMNMWDAKGRFVEDTTSKATVLPSYTDKMLGFSETGENRLVIVLDQFAGFNLEENFKMAPELKEALSGFIWYRDTLAQGRNTRSSLATLICGEACTVGALNEDTSRTLVDKITDEYLKTVEKRGPGWQNFIMEHNWMESQKMDAPGLDLIALRHTGPAFLNRYLERNGIEDGGDASDNFLIDVSLFESVPWSMKNFIYVEGKWLTPGLDKHTSKKSLAQQKEWALLWQLTENSHTEAKKNTYKFFHFETTHRPWIMDNQCHFMEKRDLSTTPKDGFEKVGEKFFYNAQLRAEVCSLKALAPWFEWMKKAGIFENMDIAIVSDHGVWPYGMTNALLLHKPKGRSAVPFETSDAPMELVDVPGLIEGRKPPKRDVRFMWNTGGVNSREFLDVKRYEVRGPVMDIRSWGDETDPFDFRFGETDD